MFENFRVSPDGRVVAFEFRDLRAGGYEYKGQWNESNARGLGLLEWRTGKLTRIPNPPGKKLIAPSWSEDGKRLVAAMGGLDAVSTNQIVEINLADFSVRDVIGKPYVKGETGHRHLTSPVFQPGTGAILYMEKEWGAIPGHLHLFDPASGTDTVVLAREDGFWSALFQAVFIGRDEIIYQARGPYSRDLDEKVRALAGYDTAVVSYHLRFGEKPRFLFPELERRKLTTDPSLTSVAATPDGKVIIAIRESLERPKNDKGQYNLEIFRIDGGKLRQLTNLRSYLSVADISFDGLTVAFGSDPGRSKRIDLFILDMNTNVVTATHVLERIEASPDFNLIREGVK